MEAYIKNQKSFGGKDTSRASGASRALASNSIITSQNTVSPNFKHLKSFNQTIATSKKEEMQAAANSMGGTSSVIDDMMIDNIFHVRDFEIDQMVQAAGRIPRFSI